MIATKPKTRHLAIAKSLYPLDWNPSDPNGFNEWAQHIHASARLCDEPEKPVRINRDLANSLINMASLVKQAKEQLK